MKGWSRVRIDGPSASATKRLRAFGNRVADLRRRVRKKRGLFHGGAGGSGMITELIGPALNGDQEAYEALKVAVYDLIRDYARRALVHERPGHTLQATALAHEIWLKLLSGGMSDVLKRENTPSVKALLGRMIRHFLIDYGRRRIARLKAEEKHQKQIDELDLQLDLTALDPGAGAVSVEVFVDAMEKLDALDAEAAEVFFLRVFAGLTWPEVAEIADPSIRAAQLAYKRAQIILARHIQGGIGA